MRRMVSCAAIWFAALGCRSGITSQSIERALADTSVRLDRSAANPEDLPDLEGPVSREAIVALAVSRNPTLSMMVHRARAMVYGARAERSLPAPELGLEIWNLPLARPYALGDVDMVMVELRQRIPVVRSLNARARAMVFEAEATLAELRSEESLTAERAADAYADYAHAARDRALHEEHLALLEQMQGAVRARFTTGGAGLAEAARADLEIANTRRAIGRIEGEVVRARATINALLRRQPGAALGPPSDTEPRTVQLHVDELLSLARQHRGASTAVESRRQGARARREAAQAEARRPEFMVGLGYWQEPGMRPGVGANVSMSLPWLWGGQRDRVEAAREEEAAEASALEAATVDAQGEIAEAHARVISAERELRAIREQALPAAERSLETVRAIYPTGNASLLEWIDVARSLLDLAMEETDVVADLAHAVAALERAVGTPLPTSPFSMEDGP